MVYNDLNSSYHDNDTGDYQAKSMSSPYFAHSSYIRDEWTKMAESTLPLKHSYLAVVNQGSQHPLQASIELRARQISNKVIWINLVSVFINLALAAVAFFYVFVDGSSALTAFGADCMLDLISSAIILWRYTGNLNSDYMEAREQIACIYLGALFELSALGIIIKGVSDIATYDSGVEGAEGSCELIYLASAATLACIVLTVFKYALFTELRDKSILLDVINTLISTIFAISIVVSQVLMNFGSSAWYLDPVLSIILALFMMAFGLKVLHQNLNILKPVEHYVELGCSSFDDN